MPNLRQVIDNECFGTIRAGGPGSGCHGQNCGRHKELGDAHTFLTNNGWKHVGSEGGFRDYEHPKHGSVSVGRLYKDEVGSGQSQFRWSHKGGHTGGPASGYGLASFKNRFARVGMK